MTIPSLPLKTGRQIPQVGLGFWKIPRPQTADLVVSAIAAGYRHFDCACDYGNEAEAGKGLNTALTNGQVHRDDLWVTSKLWNTYHRPEHVRAACTRTLQDLQLERLDLYLVHFPIALKFVPFETRYPPEWFHDPQATSPCMEADETPLVETWQAMEELVQEGLVTDIGICNVGCTTLRELSKTAHIPPAVLQVELHPMLTQQKLLKYCQQEQIAVTGFSPLGAESYLSIGMASEEERLLAHPEVMKLSEAQQRTSAQILLRWGVQRGTAVVPKTNCPDRLRENLDIFDFALTDAQMTTLNRLDRHRRFNDPGDFCEKAFNTYFPIFD